MEKQKNYLTIIIITLIVAIVAMSIFFAAYASQLDLAGSVNVTAASWNVHFEEKDNLQDMITVSSESRPVTVTSVNGLMMQYTTSLTEPGDFAEFSCNIVNEGTLNAKLTKISMNGLTASQSKYLKYKVYYNGVEYNGTTNGLSFILAGKRKSVIASVPVKVRIEYYYGEELPLTDVTVTLSTLFEYEQS